MQTITEESQQTPYAIRAATKKESRGEAEDNHTMEEEDSALEKYEYQVKYKDAGDDIENNALIKATKQEQVEGDLEEKQRTASQQKRSQLRGKRKVKMGNE